MARYGRDFDRERFGMRGGQGGMGRDFGGYGQGAEEEFGGGYRGMARGDYGRTEGGEFSGSREWTGQYGGMRSDAFGTQHGGRSGYGTGGGAYDNDFRAGQAMGRYGGQMSGGMSRGGQGGMYGGQGYGSGMYGGGSEMGSGGGYGYGGGSQGGYGGGYRTDQGFGSGGGGEENGQYGGQEESLRDRLTGAVGGMMSRMTGGGQQDETRRMRASEIMTENPETVTPEVTLAEAARKMRDLDVGIIPVVESSDSRRLRGVITDRDIAIRAAAEGMDMRSATVSEVMTSEVETCNKNDTVQTVLQTMQREQVRRVPITDREGRLVGIIAQADVATELDSHRGMHRVANTLESISEPANGGRSGGMRSQGGRPSQSRMGGNQGREGGMQGGSSFGQSTGHTQVGGTGLSNQVDDSGME